MKKWVFGLLLVFTVSIYQVQDVSCLNRGEIETEVRLKIKDSNSDVNRRKFSSAQLDTVIKVAQLKIAELTNCISSTTYIDTYADTATYTLPSNILMIYRVSYLIEDTTGTYKTIDRVKDFFSLDAKNKFWEQDSSGEPERYFTWGNQIKFNPALSNDFQRTDGIKIDCYLKPNTMTSDSDVPFNGITNLYIYHDLIVYYVCGWCFEYMGDLNTAQYYNTQYMNGLSLIMGMNQRPGWFPDMRYSLTPP